MKLQVELVNPPFLTTGPAVANTIFAVTGKHILELPMTQSGFQFV